MTTNLNQADEIRARIEADSSSRIVVSLYWGTALA